MTKYRVDFIMDGINSTYTANASIVAKKLCRILKETGLLLIKEA